MQKLSINDFSAGWVPSDDAQKGRKNGLLRMESVELDQNGALVMSGGTHRIGSAADAAAHTIYSKYIGGTYYAFVALANGKVNVSAGYAASSTLSTGGSTTRAAFAALFDSVVYFSGSVRKRYNGSTTKNIGRTAPASAPTVISGGSGDLTGTYEYIQINVMANGQWIGKSGPSAISTAVTVENQVITVTGLNPTAADADANESWIFRRGGNLEDFYRVARLTSSYTTPFDDNLSDDDALQLNIKLNRFLLTTSSSGISDAILAAVGPINGRMVYFTATSIYFSDVNSPDSYDYRTTLGIAGSSGTEQFLWALKAADNVIVVGTTLDLYTLTGTFVQFPDGFLDVYFKPVGAALPPVGSEVVKYAGGFIYMSKAGWVLTDIDGNSQTLAGLNTDLLYKGLTRHGYAPSSTAVGGNFSLAISNNKLFCRVPTSGSTRIEVYDLLRRAWRTLAFTTISKFYQNEDNTLLCFDTGDSYLKLFDYTGAKTIDDGSSTKQSFVVQTTFNDGGSPNRLKTPYGLKFRGNAGGGTGTVVEYAKDNATSFTTLTTLTGSTLATNIISLAALGDLTNIQLKLSGQTADFLLEDLEILWDEHPEQTPFLHFDFFDIGLSTPNKKKVAALAFTINTFGQDVIFTPYIDGVAGAPSIINTDGRLVAFHLFATPTFGIKYSGTLTATAGYGFEFYGPLQPEVFQTLPVGVKTFQTDPIEFLRYGKIRNIQFRIYATGNSIDWTWYNEDNIQWDGSFATVPNKEYIYEIGVEKTTSASIGKVILESSSLFHVIGIRLKFARGGRDTDLEYADLVIGKSV